MNTLKLEPIAPWVDKTEIKFLLSIGESYLQELRYSGEWIQWIHYVFQNPKKPQAGVKYNSTMCLHWQATRGKPEIHEEIVKQYWESIEKGLTTTQLLSKESYLLIQTNRQFNL